MEICVLVKLVPEADAIIQIHSDGSSIDIEDRYTLNFFDAVAVEEALRIRDMLGGGRVTCLTLGSERSIEALRTAIAMGADEGILLDDPALTGGDGYSTARALAACLRGRKYDLILCGKEAFDEGAGVVGPMVAEFLGIPHITCVTRVEILEKDTGLILQRQIEGGTEVIKAALPLLITADKGLNEPRVPTVIGVMKAARAKIDRLDLSAIGITAEEVGHAGVLGDIIRYDRPTKRPPVTMIRGSISDAVRELVRCLKEKEKVI